MTEELAVNEIFGPTIQGEGKSAGMACTFLRLVYCNLACRWCDTPYTWDWKRHDKVAEVHRMSVDDVLARLDRHSVKAPRWDALGEVTHKRNLVISGGEPMLQQQRLLPLLGRLRADRWWIEVETNGTINPIPEFLELVDQVNCSPKLSNSGEDERLRCKSLPLRILAAWPRTNFKFVIDRANDIDEVRSLVFDYLIDKGRIYLMPQGRTREEMVRTEPLASALAAQHGFKFAPRLHIHQYGDQRGV